MLSSESQRPEVGILGDDIHPGPEHKQSKAKRAESMVKYSIGKGVHAGVLGSWNRNGAPRICTTSTRSPPRCCQIYFGSSWPHLIDNLSGSFLSRLPYLDTSRLQHLQKILVCNNCLNIRMSLVSGPGRGGQNVNALPNELVLAIDQHVRYIQQLDTVRVSR